jgi:hypothetical protein
MNQVSLSVDEMITYVNDYVSKIFIEPEKYDVKIDQVSTSWLLGITNKILRLLTCMMSYDGIKDDAKSRENCVRFKIEYGLF